jgi:hypothetical protein
MHTVTFFFAIKVVESHHNYKVPAEVECFPMQTVHETPESNVLYPSYRGRAAHGLNLRECAVIHESPIDLVTGKMSFALCRLRKLPEDASSLRLEITEVCSTRWKCFVDEFWTRRLPSDVLLHWIE